MLRYSLAIHNRYRLRQSNYTYILWTCLSLSHAWHMSTSWPYIQSQIFVCVCITKAAENGTATIIVLVIAVVIHFILFNSLTFCRLNKINSKNLNPISETHHTTSQRHAYVFCTNETLACHIQYKTPFSIYIYLIWYLACDVFLKSNHANHTLRDRCKVTALNAIEEL